jgi:orotidine-5'-phosphate decarboxylase
MHKNNPIMLALDYSDLSEAATMLGKVRQHIGMIKIGLELFTAHGKSALELGNMFNIPIFLDLKLFDVPTTVSRTTQVVCEQLARCGGHHMLSIHAFGGKEMAQAAVKAADSSNVSIVGITILTSMTERDLGNIGFSDRRIGPRTIDAAKLIGNTKSTPYLDHFVCSPTQAHLMRQHLGDQVILITPGIREDESKLDDHKRTTTVAVALKKGANWLVVGRPITQASDPVYAASMFADQADRALNG